MLSKAERAKRKEQSERDKKFQQRQAQSEHDKKEYLRKAQVERHRKDQLRQAQSKHDKELHRRREQSVQGQDQSQKMKQQNSAPSILPQPRPILTHQLGLKILSEPDREEPVVDIVAVHGIGADPDYTWTTTTPCVNWLQHCSMLPHALPKARIMRFGYASRWFGQETIKQSLSSIAISFLSALCEEREDCKQRPLVFIGHCFGGLVIQQALNTAKLLDHTYPEVFGAAAGVLFMGTPHRGTGSITSTGLLSAVVASNPALQVDGTVLEKLKYGNELVNQVFHEFVLVCNSPARKISLCCLFEQRSTAVGRVIGDKYLKEFVVDEISGCIDGYPKYGLAVDHFSLNKFSEPDDGNYKVVQREIKRLVSKVLQ